MRKFRDEYRQEETRERRIKGKRVARQRKQIERWERLQEKEEDR